MEYRIVRAYGDELAVCRSIDEQVNALCEEGWRPQGGVSLTLEKNSYVSGVYVAVQAMVKE